MKYKYKASETFWRLFYKLPAKQKASVRKAWEIFKNNPFDSRLGTHKIHHLSALANRTVYGVVIESDLRTVFYLEGNTVFTFDIGDHGIYK